MAGGRSPSPIGARLLTLTAAFAFVRLYDTGVRQRPLAALARRGSCRCSRVARLPARPARARRRARDERHLRTRSTRRSPCSSSRCCSSRAWPASPARLVRPLLRRGARARRCRCRRYLALRRLARRARAARRARRRLGRLVRRLLLRRDARRPRSRRRPTEKAYTGERQRRRRRSSRTSEVLPRSFPYPLTKIEFGNGSAAANTSIGQQLDVLVVDPATLAAASCTGRAPGARTRRRCWRSSPAGAGDRRCR